MFCAASSACLPFLFCFFEHILVHTAQRTAPGCRHLFPWGAGSHTMGGISFGGVVDVAAQGAHPLLPLRFGGIHRNGTQSSDAAGVRVSLRREKDDLVAAAERRVREGEKGVPVSAAHGGGCAERQRARRPGGNVRRLVVRQAGERLARVPST